MPQMGTEAAKDTAQAETGKVDWSSLEVPDPSPYLPPRKVPNALVELGVSEEHVNQLKQIKELAPEMLNDENRRLLESWDMAEMQNKL